VGDGDLSGRLLSELVEHADDGILLFRPDGVVVFANEASQFVLGWPPEQLVGRSLVELGHPDELRRAAIVMAQQPAAGGREQRTPGLARFRQPDGSFRPVEICGSSLHDDDGNALFSMFCRRVDDRLTFDEVLGTFASEPDLRRSLEPIPRLLQWRPDAPRFTLVWRDRDGVQVVGDDLPAALVGASPEPAREPTSPGDVTSDRSPWAAAWRGSGGETFPPDVTGLPADLRALAETSGVMQFRLTAITDLDGRVRALATLWRPIDGHPLELFDEPLATAVRLAKLAIQWNDQQQRLRHDALYDDLTGLANRRVFLSTIDGEGSGSARPGCILYVDLDGFKPVNDTYGHETGDRVLVEVARRLSATTRAGDVVARIGGDEFGIACIDCEPVEAASIAARIVAVVAEAIDLERDDAEVGSVVVSASVGVASSPDGLSPELATVADGALYEAKASGGGTVVIATRSGD
jgi:diguanylate cyclase (GGDEF)-like protein/PAS domain S-box-containing protein